MITNVIPANDKERLTAVRRYDVLDTPPDGAFDRITSLAARMFKVPISIVSIVDKDRIWFKSHYGVDVSQINRDPGLCASAILQYEPWILNDAKASPYALTNPLIAGSFGLQFYAGMPLTTTDGYNLGTLCVIDKRPRNITEDEKAALKDLSGIVMDELELRLSARLAIGREAAVREKLEELVVQRTTELTRLSEHLVSLHERERAVLARELHDELGSILTALKLELASLERSKAKPITEVIRSSLELVDSAIEIKRRVITDLRPDILNLGIGPAIEWLISEFSRRTGIACTTSLYDSNPKLDDNINIVLFRTLQEALTNVARHSQASEVNVSMIKDAGRLKLCIRDNGIGISDSKKNKPHSFGLSSMNARVCQLGGTLNITSEPNAGTIISACIPA